MVPTAQSCCLLTASFLVLDSLLEKMTLPGQTIMLTLKFNAFIVSLLQTPHWLLRTGGNKAHFLKPTTDAEFKGGARITLLPDPPPPRPCVPLPPRPLLRPYSWHPSLNTCPHQCFLQSIWPAAGEERERIPLYLILDSGVLSGPRQGETSTGPGTEHTETPGSVSIILMAVRKQLIVML